MSANPRSYIDHAERSGHEPVAGAGKIAEAGVRSRAQARGSRPTQAPSSTPEALERPDSSFAARFGRIILQDGIAAVPSCLYHFQGRLDLSTQQVWFISYILSHKWDTALPYPSLHKMARNVGMSYVNLLRIRKTLVERGFLQVYDRFTEQGAPAPSAYDFGELFRVLEELVVESEGPLNPIAAEPRGEDLSRLDPSFAARYGRVILRYGVTAVPRAVFTHQGQLGLTPQQVWFITYILSFRWTTALPYPSLVKMADHTGYSRSQIHVIKAELENRGYLRTINRSGPEGGQDTNAYDFTGLLSAIRNLLAPGEQTATPNEHDEEPPRSEPARAKRRGRRTSAGDPEPETQRARCSNNARTGGSNRERTGGSKANRTEGDNQAISPVVTQAGRGMVSAAVHESEPSNEDQLKRNDSSRLSRKKQKESDESSATGVRIPSPLAARSGQDYSPYVASVIADFSAEFGDASRVVSNVTQALRIWASSGLSDSEFVERLYECRKGTRRAAAQNKMAFFFAALRRMGSEAK